MAECTNQDSRMASACRELRKARRYKSAWNSAHSLEARGTTTHCIDFVACEIYFGNVHFTANDMGSYPFESDIASILGCPLSTRGRQFVLQHLALVIECWGQFCVKRIPLKTRATQSASRLSTEEYQQAQMRLWNIQNPTREKKRRTMKRYS